MTSEAPTPIVKRFTDQNGKQGAMAPLGNGLTKLLYDDGGMVIVKDYQEKADDKRT